MDNLLLPGTIKERLEKIKSGIALSCAKTGRPPGEISILAATKSQPPEKILAAVSVGIAIFGENYLQEAEKKISEIGRNVQWHFIGHLQANKAKKAGQLFDMVQTVDSLKVAQKLDAASASENKVLPILIEVNIGEEPQKFGVLPAGVPEFVRSLSGLKNLEIRGLMCMPPQLPAEQARLCFKKMSQIFLQLKSARQGNLNPKTLSMGMSGDFTVAVEEGSTMVRIGTALFGDRVNLRFTGPRKP
jgi:hypothetical protein